MTALQEIKSAVVNLLPRERMQFEQWFYTNVFPKDDIAGHIEGEYAVHEAAEQYIASDAGRLLTYEEYLALEERSEIRHEFVAGVLFAMSGPSRNHCRISGNVFNAVTNRVRGGPCEAFIANFNVRVQHSDAGYYPDVMVTCEEEKRNQYTLEPKLLVEVLSPSTRQKDQREKLLGYRTLASLDEYVLIEQDHPEIVIYRRGTPWRRIEIVGMDAVVEFKSIGLEMRVSEIFEGAQLE